MNRKEQIREMAKNRMSICKSCPAFNETFQTCGKPLNRLNPVNESVVLNNKEFQPCGCFLPTKTQLTLWHCPADKWEPVLEKSLLQDIKSFLFQSSIKSDDKSRLKELYLFATGTDVSRQIDGCGSCGATFIHNLRSQYKDLPEATDIINQIEEQIDVELNNNNASDNAIVSDSIVPNLETIDIKTIKKPRAKKTTKK